MIQNNRPQCPECKHKMAKSGWAWSGRKQVRRYKCSRCGRVLIDTKDIKKETK